MCKVPSDALSMLNLLKERHVVLLRARHTKNPGQFKEINNRAGNTTFVDWQLVSGTLKKGYEWYSLLRHPFAKAAYMMFLVSEVHPFLDGNGRTSRLVMEYVVRSLGLPTVIISDFNDDVVTTESDWADDIGRGMLRTIQALERCEKDLNQAGCNVLPPAPLK